MDRDRIWMREAIKLASISYNNNEVPVGAVIIYNDKIVGRGYNLRERLQDPLAHAELIAIKEASRYLGSWRLIDTELYVTLEPCVMCAGAIINSRIKRVVIGCLDPKGGGMISCYKIGSDKKLNHTVEIKYGVEAELIEEMLKSFFRKLREKRKG